MGPISIQELAGDSGSGSRQSFRKGIETPVQGENQRTIKSKLLVLMSGKH